MGSRTGLRLDYIFYLSVEDKKIKKVLTNRKSCNIIYLASSAKGSERKSGLPFRGVAQLG